MEVKQYLRETIITNMETIKENMDKYHKLYNLGVDLMEYDSKFIHSIETGIVGMLLSLNGSSNPELKAIIEDLLPWVLYEGDGTKDYHAIYCSENGDMVASIGEPEAFVDYVENFKDFS